MKEKMKGLFLIVIMVFAFYGLCCLGEYISNVITIEVLSKLIYIVGAITIITLIRKGNKDV